MLNIGNNIRRIREIKNLTQEAVAELAGMSVSAFGNIERGDTDVNFRKLADIAEALQVKEEEIVTFGNNTYNTFHNHEKGVFQGIINGTNNTYTIDRDIFDKIMKDKDEEIAYLRGQIRK